jgi:hypothetical protein
MAGKGHVGKAGQLAVMAEFLLRGSNVAMPEVDLGDDIFVVHDRQGQLWRIQVKTAVGKPRGGGWRGKFSVASRQLATARTPHLHYVLAFRCGSGWEFLVLEREQLRREHTEQQAGSASGENIVFAVRLSPTEVRCGRGDWRAFRNCWDEWPTAD